MLTFFIKPTLGLTMETLPEGALNIMTQVDVSSDGTIKISFNDSDYDNVCEIFSEQVVAAIGFRRAGNSIIADLPEVEEEAVEQEGQLVEPPPDEDAEMDEEVDEDTVVAENSMIGPSEIIEHRIENDEHIHVSVAKAVGGECSNFAKQLNDALEEFNILFAKTIATKRRIEIATKQISENNPDIVDLIQQANDLVESYKFVDEVYFTESAVVFVTTPLVTDDMWAGHKRLIGKMRISITLASLFSPNPTKHRDIVSIKNLTHRLSDYEDIIWECGHVHSGNSSCFGSAFNSIFDAIVSRDLAYIAESLIRFIKTPNPDDHWGKHLIHWPIATESNAAQDSSGENSGNDE